MSSSSSVVIRHSPFVIVSLTARNLRGRCRPNRTNLPLQVIRCSRVVEGAWLEVQLRGSGGSNYELAFLSKSKSSARSIVKVEQQEGLRAWEEQQ